MHIKDIAVSTQNALSPCLSSYNSAITPPSVNKVSKKLIFNKKS